MALTRAEISKRWYYRNLEENRAYFKIKAKERYHKVTKQNLPERSCQHCSTPYRGIGKKFCSRQCFSKNFVGFKHTDKAKQKVSLSLIGKCYELARNWKGGKVPISKLVRKRPAYSVWQSRVFKKYAGTCQMCGARRGTKYDGNISLHAHHMIPVRKLINTPFEHHIYNVNNGIVLCQPCHNTIPIQG